MTATLDSLTAQQPAPPADGAFGHRLMPAGDPLAGETFDAIYTQQIEPQLVKCEAERRNAVWIFVLALVGAVALVVILYLLTPVVTGVASSTPNFGLVIVVFVIVATLGYVPLANVGKRAKVAVIQALCQPLGVSYSQAGKVGPSYPEFLSLRLLPKPTSVVFTDFFSGRRGQVDFALCEAVLTQGSGKNRRTVFRGQMFRLGTPRRLGSTTVVLRNTGWLKQFECPHGLAPVGLEDPTFNKAFAVFGSDQVEAREILTPSFMQQLDDLESAYAGAHIRCAFAAAELLIALEGRPRFGIGSLFSSLVDRARVESIARDIEQVFKMIDEFAR